jgi:hypothetical protein
VEYSIHMDGVLMLISRPNAADILCASATATTATLITVPANRWYTGDVAVSSSNTGATAGSAAVTWTPTDGSAGPSATTVLAKCITTAVGGTTTSNSVHTGILVFGGNTGGVLSFATNTATNSAVSINGFLL